MRYSTADKIDTILVVAVFLCRVCQMGLAFWLCYRLGSELRELLDALERCR